jgi:hypothetical protein
MPQGICGAEFAWILSCVRSLERAVFVQNDSSSRDYQTEEKESS